jgi:nitrite reductase (NADH) small subunit
VSAEYVVARSDELQPGQRKVVKVRGIEIGLFRIGDEYHALPNICTHQFGPLCAGKVGAAIISDRDSAWGPEFRYDGEVVCCPWHGLEFHVPTGQCLAYPETRLRKYTVKVEGDDVKIVL